MSVNKRSFCRSKSTLWKWAASMEAAVDNNIASALENPPLVDASAWQSSVVRLQADSQPQSRPWLRISTRMKLCKWGIAVASDQLKNRFLTSGPSAARCALVGSTRGLARPTTLAVQTNGRRSWHLPRRRRNRQRWSPESSPRRRSRRADRSACAPPGGMRFPTTPATPSARPSSAAATVLRNSAGLAAPTNRTPRSAALFRPAAVRLRRWRCPWQAWPARRLSARSGRQAES